jgi:membrane protein DedA with SNARE-associated domain
MYMVAFDAPSFSWVQQLIQAYGLWALFIVIMLECLGIPLPGETALVVASLYAGSTHNLGVMWIVLVAATAAIVGDNLGYLIGRSIGIPLILRYGRYVGLNEPRLKVGQFLFMQHGGKIVFFGRFIAVLRTYSALLAGVNLMQWPHFLLMNAAGGVCWASLFAFGAYFMGIHFTRIASPVALILPCGVLVAIGAAFYFFRSHEKKIEQQAAEALSGSWPHSTPNPSQNR